MNTDVVNINDDNTNIGDIAIIEAFALIKRIITTKI